MYGYIVYTDGNSERIFVRNLAGHKFVAHGDNPICCAFEASRECDNGECVPPTNLLCWGEARRFCVCLYCCSYRWVYHSLFIVDFFFKKNLFLLKKRRIFFFKNFFKHLLCWGEARHFCVCLYRCSYRWIHHCLFIVDFFLLKKRRIIFLELFFQFIMLGRGSSFLCMFISLFVQMHRFLFIV